MHQVKNKEIIPSLTKAFLKLKNEKEVKCFLYDLCTPKEINDLEERWEIAFLLSQEKYSHRDICEMTNASTTTTVRVSRFLNKEEEGGYRLVLNRLKKKKRKINNE